MKEETRISLLIEGYPRYGYQTYSRIVGSASNSLCISRLHPEYVAHKFGLERSKHYWLSGQKGQDVISPRSMHHLVKALRIDLRGRGGGVAFMDGLEYLLLFNDTARVMEGLEEIDALLRQANVDLIISVDPLTLEQNDLDRLYEAFPRHSVRSILEKYSILGSQQISEAVPGSEAQGIAGL